ncbi:MAG: hypothetical protein IKH73_09930 [Erysipelotrichaceae bacterium]|nr:hypothetical protein [Erysipelotrichaceae bacterium]
MKFKYTLEDDDLKEYYHYALKGDKQVRNFHIRLLLAGLAGGAAMVLFNKLNTTWILISVALIALWIGIVELVIFPVYLKKITESYLQKTKGGLKEMTVEVTETQTTVDGKKKFLIDCAVMPTLVVLVFKDGSNVIIPNRVLDNDINVLNQLTDTVEKQMYHQAEEYAKKQEAGLKKAKGE